MWSGEHPWLASCSASPSAVENHRGNSSVRPTGTLCGPPQELTVPTSIRKLKLTIERNVTWGVRSQSELFHSYHASPSWVVPGSSAPVRFQPSQFSPPQLHTFGIAADFRLMTGGSLLEPVPLVCPVKESGPPILNASLWTLDWRSPIAVLEA